MPPSNDIVNPTQAKPLHQRIIPSDLRLEDGLWARLLVFVALVAMVASVLFLLGKRKSRPLYGQVPKEAPPRLNLTEDDDDDEEELFNATQHKLLRKSNVTVE